MDDEAEGEQQPQQALEDTEPATNPDVQEGSSTPPSADANVAQDSQPSSAGDSGAGLDPSLAADTSDGLEAGATKQDNDAPPPRTSVPAPPSAQDDRRPSVAAAASRSSRASVTSPPANASSKRASAAAASAPPPAAAAPTPPRQPSVTAAPPPPQPPAAPAAPAKPSYDFLKRKDAYIQPRQQLPDDAEFELAKAFLQQASEKTEDSVYDHLTRTVLRMLETRPANAVDIFEAISADVKKSKFDVEKLAVPGGYKPVPEDIPGLDEAKSQSRLLEPPIPEEERPEDLGETPDIMDLANLWEWAGVSFGKEETFIIFLSLQRLVQEKPLKSVRLWGKILGLHRSYIVTEAELKDGMQDEDPAAGEPAESPENEGEGEGAAVAAEGEDAAGNASGGAAENETGLPKPKVKVIPPLSKEVRTGVNKYVYYVCNFPGGKWWRLPDVIPEKLQVARKIRKHFTGDLNKQIVSYPAFDGTEAQYLRCQIARISAATVASPAGYYTFDPQEGDGEDEEHQQTIIINPEFEGVGNATLLSPSNWVHHVPYILPQGRVTWENPLANLPKKGGEDGDGDDGDGDGSDGDGEGDGDGDEAENVEPETGPPILSPLVADEDTPDGPAWVARSCTVLSPAKFAPVMLRSTRWPGAVIVAYNDKFANVYIGDGHREVPSTSAGGLHLPPPLPPVQKEYVLMEKVSKSEDAEEEDADGGGGEMRPGVFTEQRDPTVEEETAFEEAQKAKEEQDAEEGEEGAGSEGGGEEDEEE